MPTTYAIPDGRTVMAATTYTATPGTGATISNAVNGVSFQPDLLWVKNRDNVEQHYWQDSVRGFSPSANVTKMLNSNSTAAESSLADITCTTTSSGFTVVDSAPASGEFWFTNRTYVGWQWKAGGTAVTNTDGSISAQVSANTTAGFSVVTYTGTGSAATVGHGLGVAPSMIIVKNRNTSSYGWFVWHTAFGAAGNTDYINLNLTDAKGSGGAVSMWNTTMPTSSVFSVGTYGGVNGNTNTYVAYCFAAVAGYSAFGSYTGNGSTDGPFVYLGFRPRWVLIKSSSVGGAGYEWILYDSARDTYNAVGNYLFPNTSGAEGTVIAMDFTANGFKLRITGNAWNQSGQTFIYAAFAENPFKYANAR